jgi:hypothetical protein
MHQFEITPHIGIGPIHLGATRETIRAALTSLGFALKSSRGSIDYFASAAIQVEYGGDDHADFIGVSCHRDYSLIYYGTNVFDTVADQIFALMSDRDNSGSHVFDRSGFVFPNQIVTLWEADEQYDRLGGEQRPIWAQVGLGNQRYLDAIRKIRSQSASSETN